MMWMVARGGPGRAPALYNGTIKGTPVTTLVAQTMRAGCIPRHAP